MTICGQGPGKIVVVDDREDRPTQGVLQSNGFAAVVESPSEYSVNRCAGIAVLEFGGVADQDKKLPGA